MNTVHADFVLLPSASVALQLSLYLVNLSFTFVSVVWTNRNKSSVQILKKNLNIAFFALIFDSIASIALLSLSLISI